MRPCLKKEKKKKYAKKVCHDLVSKEWATGPACGFRGAVGAQTGDLQCSTGNHSAFLFFVCSPSGGEQMGEETETETERQGEGCSWVEAQSCTCHHMHAEDSGHL